ncbi:MAG: endolytic transglycosylase MltG [Clostridia bacterium]|nr:endolytic transglycosylase MltG [Clostridia bacterium]
MKETDNKKKNIPPSDPADVKSGAAPARKKKPTDETGRTLKYKGHSAVYSVTISVVYITLILIASAALSFFILSVGNDVFALQKTERTAEVNLGMYPTVIDVSKELGDKGIIRYPAIFRLYARLKLDDGENFIPGTYTVSSQQNYDSLIKTFLSQTGERRIVSIMIPEGYTVDEIIDLFISEGIGTREGFVEAIEYGEYDYQFIKLLDSKPRDPNRRYRLEGYLFPDTYYFYSDWEETQIVNKLLAGFDAKLTKQYYEFLKKSPYSLDDYIKVASIIQKEAYFNADMGLVSSVIHNRLADMSTYPKLECDSTVLYALGVHKTDITQADLNYDDPYNTYVYDGLPPGPICNPGWSAIYTAINPEQSEYYYFVSRSSGEMLYGKTLAEHKKNVQTVRDENKKN